MFALIKTVIKDCLTEPNGTSYDLVRVVALCMSATGFPAFLGFTGYSVYASPEHRFDMVAFGTAFAAILAGIAAVTGAIALKQKTDTP